MGDAREFAKIPSPKQHNIETLSHRVRPFEFVFFVAAQETELLHPRVTGMLNTHPG
jgi:hypothetical protein